MIPVAPLAGLMFVVLAGMAVVMLFAFVAQIIARDTGWVDVFWTFGTGAAAAAAALWPLQGGASGPTERQWLAAALAAIWAVRLGGYILLRVVRGTEEDARYRDLRREWGPSFNLRLFGFLLIQAPVGAILALAVALAARTQTGPLGLRDAAAVTLWLIALAGEAIADAQMGRFRANPENRGKICEQGLWGWSRHPNYFFEWLIWLAYPVMALSFDSLASFASLAAPAVMYLILRFATGVPPLERSMAASRGELFHDYQARVSAFIPMPPRRRPHPGAPQPAGK